MDWATSRTIAVHLPLDGDLKGEITADPPRSEKYLYLMENGPVGGAVSFTGKAAWKDGEPQYGTGPTGQAGEFDGKRYVDAGNVGNFGFYDSFTVVGVDQPGRQLRGPSSAARATKRKARVSAWF